ncbi:unnamed protein product [Hydatigera taeniaeformis]|uniref:glutathione gamma-glutamylcysteinyltransferase n=1 Tax=Hydatigena taeniaeformis TaxID=6205 RepID=A0A3P7G796_HYDTA|nr:unnamed protein product [Hydatigera taeniaeformis]
MVDLRQPTSPGETVESFRSCLLTICSQSLSTSGTILVVSYDRKAVKQTGSGHYALVGGYHPKRDLILLLETAAFKYPSHWAPLTAIYNGMCALDKVTGRPRGYIAGGRLRAVADEWTLYLNSTPLGSLGKTCCCLLQSEGQERGCGWRQDRHDLHSCSGPGNCSPIIRPTSPLQIGPAHRCECPCLVDTLFDHLLAFLIKHRPPDFFFTCHPLWADSSVIVSSTTETATQVIFELVSSAAGRRARLALERLQHRSYEWLTSGSGGPLTYRPISTLGLRLKEAIGTATTSESGVLCRRPACAMPHITDPKIRATALLTAFLLAFPYHTISRRFEAADDAIATDDGGTQGAIVEALRSSNHLLYHLPRLPSQTCFTELTLGTRNELNTLSKILAQLISVRRAPGSRCTENTSN